MNWIEHFREAMGGLPVSHVWRGHGSALSLEFGGLTPTTRRDGSPGDPQGEFGLMIEWSWRVEDQRSVLCGSWSSEDLWEPAFGRLRGQRVTDVATFGRLPELLISLDGGLHVASFTTAEGDPQWALFDRRGSEPITVACRAGAVIDME